MSEDIYRRLQERLDTYSVGFPSTSTGVELEILRRLFSADDARVFLAMSPLPESAEQLAPRLGLDPGEAGARLEEMAARGLLFRVGAAGSRRYGAIPFVHGLFEFQVKRLDAGFSALVERYYADGFGSSLGAHAGGFLRTIPVERSVSPSNQVASYEDAVELLRGKDLIVVTDCVCRKSRSLVGGGCGQPLEVCFMFGSMAQYYLDHGLGRRVSSEEAVAITRRAQESGLVTQPASARNPAGMCNCCGDCCGVLRSVREHPRPAEAVFSNHFAVIDPELCTGCGDCAGRCQMDAVAVGPAGTAEVDRDRCIGCGLCVVACGTGAARLEAKPERRVPPENSLQQMLALAKRRGVL